MTHLGYLIAGWGIPLLVIGGYAAMLLRRARTQATLVPADRRRWMTADD